MSREIKQEISRGLSGGIRRGRSRIMCAVAALVMVMLSAQTAWAEPDFAQASRLSVFAVEGEDAAIAKSGRKEIKATAGMPLGQGQSLRTGEATWMYLEADEDKTFKMDSTTLARITQASAQKLKITVEQGKLYFNIERPLSDGSEVTFDSAQTSLSIRGTSGVLDCRETGTSIYLITGRAQCTVDGETVILEAGEMLQTEKGSWPAQGNQVRMRKERIREQRSFDPSELPLFVRADVLAVASEEDDADWIAWRNQESRGWNDYRDRLRQLQGRAEEAVRYTKPIERDSESETPAKSVEFWMDGEGPFTLETFEWRDYFETYEEYYSWYQENVPGS